MLLDFGSRKWVVASLVPLGMLAACGGADESQTSGPVLSYSDAFIMQPIGGRDMTMAGLELNVSGGEATLVAAQTPAAEVVELHTVSMQDGRMQMRQVESLTVSEESPLSLKRGSDHLMVFGVTEPLTVGESVDITLSFETANGPQTLVVDAEVRSLAD